MRQLESLGEVEVESRRIGELVIEGLRSLDAVAFVRFASVYRDFREVSDFSAVIDELESGGDGAAFASGAGDPEKP